MAVPEGRPREGLHAAAAVPATPEESLAASGSRKRTGSAQEADLERVVKKRADVDSDEDVIVLSQPGTQAHEVTDNRPTSANTVGHHAVSLMRNAPARPPLSSSTAKLCWTWLTFFSSATFMYPHALAGLCSESYQCYCPVGQ